MSRGVVPRPVALRSCGPGVDEAQGVNRPVALRPCGPGVGEAQDVKRPVALRSCGPGADSRGTFDDYCVLLEAASDEPVDKELASQLFAASQGRGVFGGSDVAAADRGVEVNRSSSWANYCALLDAASGEQADRRMASRLFDASRSGGGGGGAGGAAAGEGVATACPGAVGGAHLSHGDVARLAMSAGAGEPWRGVKRVRDAQAAGGDGLDGAQRVVRRRLTCKQALPFA